MSRRLITERSVREAAQSGKPLQAGPDSIVTPAARDLARALGVALGSPVSIASDEPARSVQPASPFSVAVGSDHGGFQLKESLKHTLTSMGLTVIDVGCPSTEAVDYPVFAARVADLVASDGARFGIMVDGAGIGSAMVANKIAGVRAAMCYDLTTAKNAREHNNANLLTLGGATISEAVAVEIVRTFLTTAFAAGRHQRRVSMIDALDREA